MLQCSNRSLEDVFLLEAMHQTLAKDATRFLSYIVCFSGILNRPDPDVVIRIYH